MEQHQKARKQMVILSSVSVAAGIHAGLDSSMTHSSELILGVS